VCHLHKKQLPASTKLTYSSTQLGIISLVIFMLIFSRSRCARGWLNVDVIYANISFKTLIVNQARSGPCYLCAISIIFRGVLNSSISRNCFARSLSETVAKSWICGRQRDVGFCYSVLAHYYCLSRRTRNSIHGSSPLICCFLLQDLLILSH
jgi:hypothetical protein